MPKRKSRKKTITNINRLPAEILFNIFKRLSIKKKFLLKAVCKKWNTIVVSHVLPQQHKLSIEKDVNFRCTCIDPNHQFQFADNNSISVFPVRGDLNRKWFFGQGIAGVKVLKICEPSVIKYYLSEGPSSSLECLNILCLQKPLVKVLPNLQHFSAKIMNIASLISVLEYCPILTHLSIDTIESKDNFVDTFINLPKGLQYLKWTGRSSCVLAVLCSPAMQTLESLLLINDHYWSPTVSFDKPDARVKPAPRLQRFSMFCGMYREQDKKMIIDFLKECPILKKFDSQVIGLTLEDHVNIFSRLSNLETIKLVARFEYDDVIPMILEKNRKSLKYLEIGKYGVYLETMKKLAEFPNLQTLSFRSMVRILVLTDRKCVHFVPFILQPSDEQLLAFAQRRLEVSQSPLKLKYTYWDTFLDTFPDNFDPVGRTLQDANIQLVRYTKLYSVMD